MYRKPSSPTKAASHGTGFTLIELLVVMAIIAILVSLVIGVAGFAQRKGATARAETEVAALMAALESYKADMGDYPVGENGNPTTSAVPGNNAFLRQALAPTATNTLNPLGKIYFEFPLGMGTNKSNPGATNQNVIDPFGEPYGYRYAPTNGRFGGMMSGIGFFDLWSRSGTTNRNAWTAKSW